MLGKPQRTVDIFISHAWRYHEDWNRVCTMLDAYHPHAWRNFSLPWFDPALSPATEFGGQQLRWSLESQIIPVHAVILLSSVFAQHGSRKWIDFEIGVARKHAKPIIALPASGQSVVSQEVAETADAIAIWDARNLLDLVDRISVNVRLGTSTSTPPATNPAGAPR
jgi:hypothetical protein